MIRTITSPVSVSVKKKNYHPRSGESEPVGLDYVVANQIIKWYCEMTGKSIDTKKATEVIRLVMGISDHKASIIRKGGGTTASRTSLYGALSHIMSNLLATGYLCYPNKTDDIDWPPDGIFRAVRLRKRFNKRTKKSEVVHSKYKPTPIEHLKQLVLLIHRERLEEAKTA